MARRRPSRSVVLAVPRRWGIRSGDVLAVVIGNAVLIVGMWLRHGGLTTAGNVGGGLTAAGQLTALLGTYAALVQIVLMSRVPWLEHVFGLDLLARWHRWLGFTCTWLILGHVLLTTAGYAVGDGVSLPAELARLVSQYPYVLMAAAGTALLVMAAALSVRAARRRLSHETWYFVHLYLYLAIALSFGHQLMVGSDLSSDPIAEGYWVALYVAVIGFVLSFRVGHPLRLAARHRLRVARIVDEAPGIYSIYITGRRLHELPVRAGQFFRWRFMTRDAWWRSHPFSLSAAPNGRYLRLTVKVVGDHTTWLRGVTPGTPVIAEGPHGVLTSLRRSQPRALLIAAGIGITPLRALLEELPGGKGRPALIYRARTWDDVAFRDEIDQIMKHRSGEVHYVVGRRGRDIDAHPLGPRALRRMVPDLHTRDIFVCGPQEMIDEVCQGLSDMGVPRRQVHRERFALLESRLQRRKVAGRALGHGDEFGRG